MLGASTPASSLEISNNELNSSFIAVDGTSVYWTNASPDGGTVMKCAAAGCGGNGTTLATAQGNPQGIAVDGTSVYWANYTAGTVMKLTPK